MPELGIINTPYLTDLQRKKGERDMLFPGTVVFRGKEHGYTYINRGEECIVFAYPGEKKKVLSIDYKDTLSIKDAKLQYYYHNILATVFPHNFPRMHASFGSNSSTDITGDVRQRIAKARKKRPAKIHYPLRKVRKISNDWALPFTQDFNPDNVITTAKGEEFYVDTLTVDKNDTAEIDNIIIYMRHHHYSDTDIKKVQRYQTRMKDIWEDKLRGKKINTP